MKISEVISFLETKAHHSLQEPYDNTGLLIGDSGRDCTGILCALDATEEVIKEAITKKCNLVAAHHPVIFGGLKKINGKNYTEKAVITAIKNDVAVYAIHTSLDNVMDGVNGKIASLLGLQKTSILQPKEQSLKKLFTFVPAEHAETVRQVIFNAGGGHIGNYSECSFNTEGTGTFRPDEDTNPFVGNKGHQHREKEIRIEVIIPAFAEKNVVEAMKSAHPYEEVAFDVVPLSNPHSGIGSGLLGELPAAMEAKPFLARLKSVFNIPVIRHTDFINRDIQRVAVCGGAGSFLITKALAIGADAYVTADIKYHEFFDANGKLMICDVGHFESEQFTVDLLRDILQQKFPTFAVLKTEVKTNPVHYF
ncbi:MAG: Nif3-like dinuclear metal center hexameric protein [Bacteroidetes bacterium]|nr:Nif3-like dinuclear metal center hexameric protein [Bacteroidota bacterium]